MKTMADAVESRNEQLPSALSMQIMEERADNVIQNAEAGNNSVGLDWSFLDEGRLYGRQEELMQLREAFHRRVALASEDGMDHGAPTLPSTAELLLVSGESGSGKSILVQTALQNLAQTHGGYFVMGKFDQLQIPEPYAPFVAAITELLVLLQSANTNEGNTCDSCDDSEGSSSWVIPELKQRLESEMRPEACTVLCALVPELSRLCGKGHSEDEGAQPFPSLSGRETQQEKLKTAIRTLLRVICSPSHPLVLALDDLQWADSKSLALLESLVSDDLPGLMVVLICRQNEVDVHHEFARLLRRLEDEESTRITHIQVTNLSLEATKALMTDVLRQSPDNCHTLANVLHEKTNGNVFFLVQLLKTLHEEGVLVAERIMSQNAMDTEQIQQQKHQRSLQWLWHDEQWKERFGDDPAVEISAVELIARRIKRLTKQCQRILCIAACLGADFDVNMMRDILKEEDVCLENDLTTIIEEGYVVQRYHPKGVYAFRHDGIQKAAYTLVIEEQKPATHLSIGRALYDNMSEENLEDNIYLVVDQMVRGSVLLKSEDDQYGLAHLCLQAGRKATHSSDFLIAHTYYEIGIGLLPRRHWRDEYDLSFNLYSSSAEAACCEADFDSMDATIEQILANTRNYNDKIRAYTTQIYSLGARMQLHDAVEVGREVLANLGVKLPSKPGVIQLILDLTRVKRKLKGKSDSEILGLPDIDINENQSKAAAMTIMSMMSAYTFVANPELYPFLVFRMVTISLEYGMSAMSSHAFGVYGTLTCAMDNIEEGYRFGMLSLKLLDRYGSTKMEWLPRVYANAYGCIVPWKKPLVSTLRHMVESHAVGKVTGDMDYSSLAIHIHSMNAFVAGVSLLKVQPDIEVGVATMKQCKQKTWHSLALLELRCIQNLTGKSNGNPLALTSQLTDDAMAADASASTPDSKVSFQTYNCSAMVYQLVLAYHFEDMGLALDCAKRGRQLERMVKPSLLVWLLYFYEGMAALKEARKTKKRKHLICGRKAIRMFEMIAGLCSDNGLDKVYLLKAELLDVQGNHEMAMEFYTKAIHQATNTGFLYVKALACECFGLALQRWGNMENGHTFLQRCIEAYQEWGATAVATFKQKQFASKPEGEETETSPVSSQSLA